MKNLAIIAIIVGILAMGTVVALQFTEAEESLEETSTENPTTSTCSNNGGCTKDNSCGQSGCGVKTTGSCGCGR